MAVSIKQMPNFSLPRENSRIRQHNQQELQKSWQQINDAIKDIREASDKVQSQQAEGKERTLAIMAGRIDTTA